MTRRFPPPWTIDDSGECLIIKDAKGFALAYVYYCDDKSRRDLMDRMTRDEARRVAVNIAKLPDLLRKE